MSSSSSSLQEQELINKTTICLLYNSLKLGDAQTITDLLDVDLEWWFHGPPSCEYMMRILTGKSRNIDFEFNPKSITTIGDRVFVEGWDDSKAYWVHVWTLKDCIVTQLREYLNTCITVTDLNSRVWKNRNRRKNLTVWKSHVDQQYRRSLPGLVLTV